jgi:hypothetical protein
METKENVRSLASRGAELLEDYDFVTSGPDGGCREFSGLWQGKNRQCHFHLPLRNEIEVKKLRFLIVAQSI